MNRVTKTLNFAIKRFLEIDGSNWASAFAFNAFFSLFPLMILLVTIASSFVDRDSAGKEVIAYMGSYVPISGEMQAYIFDTLTGVINARTQAGAITFLILVWGALQCFSTLISVINRAWGVEMYSWWRLPLKSLVLLTITALMVFLGMVLPVSMRLVKARLFSAHDFYPWLHDLAGFFIPLCVLFFSLTLFYRLAPRRLTRFSEVWLGGLCATVFLRVGEILFVIYLRDFATLNAVYGALGGIMALLLWIYVSGCIFIFGACLCAGQAEMSALSANKTKNVTIQHTN